MKLLKKNYSTLFLFTFFLSLYFLIRTEKEIPTNSQKINTVASFSLASDEIVVDILQADQSLHKLVALSTLADNPKYSFIPEDIRRKIPYRSNRSLEKIISLKPDLIFTASFNRLSITTPLKQSGIKVKNLSRFNSLEDLYENYNLIGKSLERENISSKIIQKIKNEIRSIQEKYRVDEGNTQTVLAWLQDGTCIGQKTLLDDVITNCGGTNILKTRKIQGWSKLSMEQLALQEPDWIITSYDKKEKNNILKTIKKHPVLQKFLAVKKKNIIFLSQKEMSTQSSSILKTVEHVCRRLQQKRI